MVTTEAAHALRPAGDNAPGWSSHHVVVKEGMVYDALAGPHGMATLACKQLWEYVDVITLDSEEERMVSVFELLDDIRKRPGMYVGGDESQRVSQLQNLEQLLCGYCLALRHHRIQERVLDFNKEFGAYLWETRGWSASCGPVAAIRDTAKSDAEAWELFWRLVDEFRVTVDAR